MSKEVGNKLKWILQLQPHGIVLTNKWLKQYGYSDLLLKKYRDSNWLSPVGNGAMIRKGEHVTYFGALFALQKQLKIKVHLGGKSALALSGLGHYIEFGPSDLILFGSEQTKLPGWFVNWDWPMQLKFFTTGFIPPDMALQKYRENGVEILISSPIRAILECLYLVPNAFELEECYQIMLGLNGLRPFEVQQILEKSKSIKVNRLFLYLAEKVNHSWYNYVDTSKINLGKGDRSIYKAGAYNAKFKITVPKELEDGHSAEL